MTVTPSVASIYAAWLTRHGLTAEQAAPRLGISVATSYHYANGNSVPTNVRAADFAVRIDCDPAEFTTIAAADRVRLRRIRARQHRLDQAAMQGDRHVRSPVHQLKQVRKRNQDGGRHVPSLQRNTSASTETIVKG